MAQTNDSVRIAIDLSDFESQLSSAEEALEEFSTGAASKAASRIEQSFSGVANTIERELKRATRSGEFDLGRLTSSLVSDFTQIATGSLVGALGGDFNRGADSAASVPSPGGGRGPSNMTINFAAGSEPRAALGSVNQLASAVAQAAIRGGRFL